MDADARRDRMEQVFEALRVLRISWIVALVAFALLVVPDQVRDLYRGMAESLLPVDGKMGDISPVLATILMLLVAALLTYYIGRHRAFVYLARSANPGAVLISSLRLGPPICGALLFAGTALGLYLAISDLKAVTSDVGADVGLAAEMGRAITNMWLGLWALIAAGLLFLTATYGWSTWKGPTVAEVESGLGKFWLVLFYVVAIFMVASAFFPGLSVSYSQYVGSLAIFFLFLSVLLLGLALLQGVSDRHGIPYVLLLVVWSLIWTALDGGNMHRVGLIDRSVALPEDPQVGVRFRQWLNARNDKDAFAGKPYPVFLISSEAGGLYAAQFTAKVLARIQDQCPSFAQHVFAISGVSGGSLGAAMFSSLAKKEATNAAWKPCKFDLGAVPKQGPLEAKVDKLLERDFLAPIMSRALFADILQHVVPISWASEIPGLSALTQLGRGRALDESIEDAWATSVDRRNNPFGRSFLEHWDATDAGPALLINTTNVEDGRLVVISPFWDKDAQAESDIGYLHSRSIAADKDITLGTAVGLSGRFPWILPPAKIPKTTLALVDGAYFESSGLETLRSVRFALRDFERTGSSDPISLHIIIIGSQQPEAAPKSGLLDEATPPVRTMLNVRLRRGYSVRNALLQENQRRAQRLCARTGPRVLNLQAAGAPAPEAAPQDQAPAEINTLCTAIPEPQFILQYERFGLPLGWKLSHFMEKIVEQHSRGRCLPTDAEGQAKAVNPDASTDSVQEIFWQNKRSEFLVAKSLTPDSMQESLLEFQQKCP